MQKLLNRNETLFPPSPKCLKSIRQFKVSDINQYAAGYYNSALIDELEKMYKFPREQIIVGYGSEDIIRHIFDSLEPDKDKVLTHELHFTYYDKYLAFRKIDLRIFKIIEDKNEFVFDIDDCIRKYQSLRPKLIIITSPNNPTGNVISFVDLRKVLDSVSKKTIVLVDEAYFGFDIEYDEQAFISLTTQYPNLIITRTFSKLYALAGLRIGYAFCGSAIKNMINYQNRYLGMNRMGEGVAVAALQSKQYYTKIARTVIADRNLFISEVNKLRHFKAFNSKANLVCIKADEKVLEELKQEINTLSVLIAKFVSKNILRVSLGLASNTRQFTVMLKKVDQKMPLVNTKNKMLG